MVIVNRCSNSLGKLFKFSIAVIIRHYIHANPKKKRVQSAINKRSHSVGPVTQISKIAVPRKENERRCQSLSASNQISRKSLNDAPLVPVSASSGAATRPPPVVPSGCALSPATSVLSTQNETASNASSKIKSDREQPELSQAASNKTLRCVIMKKRDFIKLRSKLIQQQNMFLEQYASLKELESKVGIVGDECGDVRVLSVTGWPAHDLLLLVRADLETPFNSEISGHIGPQVLSQLIAQLSPIPKEVLRIAEEIMMRRNELVTTVRNKFHMNRVALTDSAPKYKNLEWRAKSQELDNETEKLERMIKGITENMKAKIKNCIDLAKVPWIDRETMAKRIDRLQKENMTFHQIIEDFTKKEQYKVGEIKERNVVCATPAYQALSEELSQERAACETLREAVAAADNKVRTARTRMAALERQLKDAHAEMDTMRRKHKDLEQLYRHRETSYDARSKKLIEVSKTGESTIETLSLQRDALEMRVKELREHADMVERTAESREAALRARAESLQTKILDQEKTKIAAESRANELEKRVLELNEKIDALTEQSAKLLDQDRGRYLEYTPAKQNTPSDRETEIWIELQTTRDALSRMEEELRQSRADKDNFLNSLSRIAQGEGCASVQDKMALELVDREQIIGKLQQTIEDHNKNQKQMVQKLKRYESQLTSLRLEVKRLRNYDFSNEIPYQDLQTELLELHMRVESQTQERAALVSAAASRALMLERHERAAELFARITRARTRMSALLSGLNEPQAVRPSDFASVERSLSSMCTHSNETWSALQAERARVLHLESAVLTQSLQLERAGSVRTQLERRRAQLEHDISLLQANDNSETTSISKSSSLVICT